MTKRAVLLLIIFLVFLPVTYAECTGNLKVAFSLSALDQEDTNLPSKHTYPYFREGDLLIMDYLYIKNGGNCTYPESIFNMYLQSPTEKNKLFCDSITIPQIKKNGTLRLDISQLKEANEYYDQGWRYKCITTLDTEGEWLSYPDMTAKNKSLPANSGTTLGIIANGKSNNHLYFKVKPKLELDLIDLIKEGQRRSASYGLVGLILGAILTFGVGELRSLREQKKRKKVALTALYREVRKNEKIILELNEKKDKILKNKLVPFHNFITLNLEKVLSGHYSDDIDFLNLLFGYFTDLQSLNNLIYRARMPNPHDHKDMIKVYIVINGNKDLRREILRQLEGKIRK